MTRTRPALTVLTGELGQPGDPDGCATRVVVAAQRWASETLFSGIPFPADSRSPVDQAALALMDAVHDLDCRVAGQGALFPPPGSITFASGMATWTQPPGWYPAG